MATKPRPVGYPQGPATNSGWRQVGQSMQKPPSSVLSSNMVKTGLCLPMGDRASPSSQPSLGKPGFLWHRVKTASHRHWNARERALRLVAPGEGTRKGEEGHSLPRQSWREWGAIPQRAERRSPDLRQEWGVLSSGALEPRLPGRVKTSIKNTALILPPPLIIYPKTC